MKKIAIGLFLLISLLSLTSAASVGALPGLIEIDNVEPGDDVERDIYVTTNFNENFTVNPSASSDDSSRIIERSENSGEVSEQGSAEWISLEETTIEPNTSITDNLSDGTPINAEGVFEFKLDIPEDAEPGIHHGTIGLNADIESEGEGTGAITFGETRLRYVIDVEGEARRDISVQDVRGFRTDTDIASVEVLLNNQGTVTTSVDDFELNVIDERGSDVANVIVDGIKLSPGESEWTNANWGSEMVEEGSYQVDGEVNYITGAAYASGGFSLSDVIEVVPEDSPEVEGEGSSGLPMWLIGMILVVLGVLMWSFEIDPVWIFGIIGVLGISGFILLSSVSNVLLAGILIPTLLIVYLGV